MPKGTEHCQETLTEECSAILLEPKTTLNTGTVVTDRTVRDLEKLSRMKFLVSLQAFWSAADRRSRPVRFPTLVRLAGCFRKLCSGRRTVSRTERFQRWIGVDGAGGRTRTDMDCSGGF